MRLWRWWQGLLLALAAQGLVAAEPTTRVAVTVLPAPAGDLPRTAWAPVLAMALAGVTLVLLGGLLLRRVAAAPRQAPSNRQQ